MVPAAIYGALVATAYVWALSLVNVYSFPDLPLGMDWLRAIGTWVGLAVAFALFGVIAAWFTEEYAGIVGGALIFTALLAIWFLISARTQNSNITAQSIITTLPLIGVNMLAAWGLRWAARRHIAITHEKDPGNRRNQMLKHIGIILLIGLIPGLFARWDRPVERTIGQLHELLQAAPSDESTRARLPLRQVPALQDHFGVDYKIYARQSAVAVGTMDVTVRFEDGFVMSCQLPVATEIQFITTCSEGEKFIAIR
jgi:hypothetical protein